MDMVERSKALASDARTQILQWLKDPSGHFPHQVTEDPAKIGVCVSLIAEKLKMGQPATSRHLEVLRRAGFVKVYRHGGWAFFSRNEDEIQRYRNWINHDL